MLLTISLEFVILFIENKSIYLSMNLGASIHARWRVRDFNTFHKVLGVFSERMLKREELTMFVERRKLATILQPEEPHMVLAY
jgi:hypothetical protein